MKQYKDSKLDADEVIAHSNLLSIASRFVVDEGTIYVPSSWYRIVKTKSFLDTTNAFMALLNTLHFSRVSHETKCAMFVDFDLLEAGNPDAVIVLYSGWMPSAIREESYLKFLTGIVLKERQKKEQRKMVSWARLTSAEPLPRLNQVALEGVRKRLESMPKKR